MDAPQSGEDVQRVVEGLKTLDPLLDIRWNPDAVKLSQGSYTVMGKLIPATYDGRWEVIRYDSETTRPTAHRGDPVIIYQVRDEHDGYKPLGEWLVQFMRSWDAANVDTARRLMAMLHDDDQADASAENTAIDGIRDSLDRAHFVGAYAGGVGNWQGRGMDLDTAGDIIRRAATTAPNGQSARVQPE